MWQLKWIEKERSSGEERAEVLVSISQDGRVTQWSIRKGFESYGELIIFDIFSTLVVSFLTDEKDVENFLFNWQKM